MRASVMSWLSFGAGVLLLGLTSACGTPAALPQGPAAGDCHLGDSYEFWYDYVPDTGSSKASRYRWFGTGDAVGHWFTMKNDSEPGGVATIGEGPIEGGGRCGGVGSASADTPNPNAGKAPPLALTGMCCSARGSSSGGVDVGSDTSLLFSGSGNRDWGFGFGNWSIANGNPLGGAGWDGLALWARAKATTADGGPWPSDPGMTVALGDRTTTEGTGYCVPAPDAGPGLMTTNPAGQVVSIGGVAATNTCGNLFEHPLVLSSEWQLYLLPWASFTQSLNPNRRAGVFDPVAIYNIIFRAPKEAVVEWWINVTLYRAKR
jgi:hypothetical protein